MSDRVLTAHIPVDLAKEVDRLALRLDRPKGWVVKEALKRYVELELKRHALTLEALADVDSGRTLDQSDVESWAKALRGNGRKRPGR